MTSNSINDDVNILNDSTDCYKLSKDQYGCRYLQKQLENDTADKQYLNIIFKNLLTNYQELAVDPFGNYLLQKIVDYLDEPSLELLILELQPNLYSISKNQFGTRSLQKIIDCICHYDGLCETLVTDGFMKISVTNIVDLINDVNANHVIQKCIFKFKNFYYDFIINAMVTGNNIIKISKNKHGCCVLQKLLSNCSIHQIYKIMLKILEYDFDLINDQFGNYIVQFLLDVNTEITISDERTHKKKKIPLNLCYIIKFMELENLDLIKLSCLKFSSNVIEKLLITFFDKLNQFMKYSSDVCVEDDSLFTLQRDVIKIISLFSKNINTLIKDNYGNYTLQTLLDTHNYQNLIERYWKMIEKYKPLENMRDQENFKITLSSNVFGVDDDLGSNYEEEVKLQKCLQYFSGMVDSRDPSLNEQDVFLIEFILEINGLIKSAHSLLGQIKSTSYSKKIKLKLKRYYQEIYHSSNVPKSLITDGPMTHSRKQSGSKMGNHSRGHSMSHNNGRVGTTPKQHSHSSSIGNVEGHHSRTVSSGPAILDAFGTNGSTPIDEFQGENLEGYFDSRMAMSNAWNYYSVGSGEQHQRHFSLPSNTYNGGIPQENMWAVKPATNSGFGEGRAHVRTSSLVESVPHRGGFDGPAMSGFGSGGFVSPGAYRQGMNYTPVDYTEACMPSGQPMPKLSSLGHRPQLSVGNNTLNGHKKELSTNSSNSTSVNPMFGQLLNAGMPPYMHGHKPHGSVGSIGSDANTTGNTLGTAPLVAGSMGVQPQGNMYWGPGGHMRHSSQGSIWAEQGALGSSSQGYLNGASGKGMVQQTLQEQEYLYNPQQYNYS